MTILELSNKIFFQWLFLRLTRCRQYFVLEYDKSGEIKRVGKEEWYSIQGWIIPMTGWRGDFKVIGSERWFWRITKKVKGYKL